MAKNGFSGLLAGTGGWRPNMPMVLNGISMMSGAGPMPGMGAAAIRVAEDRRDRDTYARMLQQPGVLDGLTPQQQAVVRNLNPKAGMKMLAQLQSRKAGSGTPKHYGTVIWGKDADGKPVPMQPTIDGRLVASQMPEGVQATGGAKKIDLGTHWGFVNRNGDLMHKVEKDLSGAEVAKGEGRAIAKQRSEIGQKYENLQQKSEQTDLVSKTIDEATAQADAYTTGPAGWALRNIPGTDAYSLSQKLTTIKANLGFDKLQAMRDASPTGGALGQVSEMENRLLQSVWGSVEQSQSPAELRKNLGRVKAIMARAKKRLIEAYQRDMKAIREGRLAMPPGGLPNPAQMLSNNTSGSGGWSIRRVK